MHFKLQPMRSLLHRMLLISLLFLSCSSPAGKNPHIEIKTKYGNIEIELYPDQAPKSVAAFLSYVDSGFYKNAYFYRVLNDSNQPSDYYKAWLIQGGIWRNNRKRSQALPGIPHESTQQTKILHKDGTMSLRGWNPELQKLNFLSALAISLASITAERTIPMDRVMRLLVKW